MSEIQTEYKVNLEQLQIPKLSENKNYNNTYHLAGSDNRWFNHLIDLYNSAPLHQTIINNLHHRITKDINESLFSQITYDYLIHGGYCILVEWDLLHKKINKLTHKDFSKVRCGIIGEDEELPNFYYYNSEWNRYNNKIKVYQRFSIEPDTEDVQLFYYKKYVPGNEIYPRPTYLPGLEWIFTEKELKRYYSNLVKNNFVANSIVNVPGLDEERQKQFIKDLQEFKGSDNAGSVFCTFSDSPIDIKKFNNDEDDKRYRYITDKIDEKVALAHNIPIALLVQTPGKLTNSSDLEVYNKIYDEYVVQPTKADIMIGYTELKNNLRVTNE